MTTARRFTVVLTIATALLSGVEQRTCAQQPAPPATSQTPPPVVPPKKFKPVEKIHIVGYALLVLMIGLGVLVVCHYRQRKDRPDLPKEMLEERLRHGMKPASGKPG